MRRPWSLRPQLPRWFSMRVYKDTHRRHRTPETWLLKCKRKNMGSGLLTQLYFLLMRSWQIVSDLWASVSLSIMWKRMSSDFQGVWELRLHPVQLLAWSQGSVNRLLSLRSWLGPLVAVWPGTSRVTSPSLGFLTFKKYDLDKEEVCGGSASCIPKW